MTEMGSMAVKYILCRLSLILCVTVLLFDSCSSMSKEEKNRLRLKAHEMFHHAYGNYMDHAYPADELMPLSCKGRYRGVEPSRGDIDDALGNFSLSLIDALDTLVILGDVDEFEKAVRLVISSVTFDSDIVVSVFETNIRVLGGLLGSHLMALQVNRTGRSMLWYNNELLELALDLGRRLLPAFNTSTGIPFPRVNLRYGVKHELSRTGEEKDTCTACAGTMILEFSALSRLTGDTVFEEKAVRAMDYLWQSRHRASDLVGMVINIHNGDWVRRDSGVGAGIDSYYEYLLKAYIMLGDEIYLDRFNKHYKAIMKYVSNGPLMLDVHMHKPQTNSKHFMDALLAFWPGLQVLKGDLKAAIEMHEMLYQIIQRHNFLPEAFTSDFRVHWAQHPLRPEFVESTYFIYKATGDPYYLEVGKSVIENLDRHARVPCGFAAIKDVTTGAHEDQMDSFVLAETFKYLYLLFSEKEDLIIDVNDYVFTTEAHLLPLFLSPPVINSSQITSNVSVISDGTSELDRDSIDDNDDDYVCPSSTFLFKSNVEFANHVRSPLKNMVEQLCPKPMNGHITRLVISLVKEVTRFCRYRPSRLRASDFIAGNAEHLSALNRMGIKLVTMNDGRVQLLHVSSEAVSTEDSNEGMLFMQDMIELSKTQAQDSQEPRVVQFVSHPFLGNDVLRAGSAQFGLSLKGHPGIQAEVVVTEPFRACQPVSNVEQMTGKIALFERGDCMFIDKARNVQAAGAVGGIVFDNNSHSSADIMSFFSMSGDGRSDITIPLVFLFGAEAHRVMEALRLNRVLTVHIGETAKRPNDILVEYLTSNHIGQKPSTDGGLRVISDTEHETVSSESSNEGATSDLHNVDSSGTAESFVGSDVKRLRVSVQLNMNDLTSRTFTDADSVSVTVDDDNIFSWQTASQFIQVSTVSRTNNKGDTSSHIILEESDRFLIYDNDMAESSVSDDSGASSPSSSVRPVVDDSAKFRSVLNTLISVLNLNELSTLIEQLSNSRTSDVECSEHDSSLGLDCTVIDRVKTNIRVLRSGNTDSHNEDNDQHQVKAVFDALLLLLQKCTNWNALPENDASTETLARLTEYVFTEGKMGFGVQTENALLGLARLLAVSDACKVNDVGVNESGAVNGATDNSEEMVYSQNVLNSDELSAHTSDDTVDLLKVPLDRESVSVLARKEQPDRSVDGCIDSDEVSEACSAAAVSAFTTQSIVVSESDVVLTTNGDEIDAHHQSEASTDES